MFKKIRKYLEKRKVITAVGSFDEVGLLIAIEEMRRDLLPVLIEREISVDCIDDRGVPALIKAVKSNDLPMVKILIDAQANIDIQNKEGKTAIMQVIEEGNKHIFTFLMDQDPDLEITDKLGDTALIKAAREGNTSISRKLIEAGVDIDASNKKGITALMIAVDHLRTGIIKSLLHAGADPNIKDYQSHSVMDRHHSSPRITQMLKEASVRHKLNDGNYVAPQKTESNNSSGLFSQVQGLSSFLLGMTADALNLIEKNKQLSEFEEKGRLMLSQMNPESIINAGPDREEAIAWLQEQVNWGLNLLVDLKNINSQLKILTENGTAPSSKGIKKLQEQASLLVSSFSQFLAEQNEIQTQPEKEVQPEDESSEFDAPTSSTQSDHE